MCFLIVGLGQGTSSSTTTTTTTTSKGSTSTTSASSTSTATTSTKPGTSTVTSTQSTAVGTTYPTTDIPPDTSPPCFFQSNLTFASNLSILISSVCQSTLSPQVISLILWNQLCAIISSQKFYYRHSYLEEHV